MNVKKQIKKVAAVGASIAIAATTMVSALAYDLSDYPAPFVEDGVFNGAIVVGATAATQDVLGAIDIAASLQAESKTGTASSGGSGVTVVGGEDFDEVLIGEYQAFDSRLDDSDLEGFVDSDFDFDDEDIDYEDYIALPNGNISIAGSQTDEDYGMDLYAEIANPENIGYFVEIEADFNSSLLGATNHDDEIEFKFLGKTVTVTAFPDATSMTIEASSEYYLEEGDSVTVDGHEIELRKVGSNAVLVSVDGQTLSISDGETEEFDQADDFEVELVSYFYIENAADNSATLRIGESISDTVSDGDSAELFGEPSDEDEADWLWSIAANDGANSVSTIGVVLNIDRTGNDANEADERDALMVGDSIDFPNGYASIEFAELSETSFTEITVAVDDDIDLSDGETGGDRVNGEWGLHIWSDSGNDDFDVGGQDTSEVWVVYYDGNGVTAPEIWYEDNGDEVNASGQTSFTLDLDSQVFTFTPSTNLTASQNFTIAFPSGISGYSAETLRLNAAFGNDFFGSDEEEESDDLLYGATGIGAQELDGEYFMTNYGAYFEDGDSQFSSGNEFVFMVPDEIQEATIVVKSKGSVVSAGSSGSTSYSVNPIGLGLGILDTDAPALGSKPMIVVGGPYANTVAADLLGNPTPEQISETFTDGKALIRWYDNQQAMLVAGWSAQDTQGASYVVAKYDQFDLSGDEVEVIVTSLDNIQVNAVN